MTDFCWNLVWWSSHWGHSPLYFLYKFWGFCDDHCWVYGLQVCDTVCSCGQIQMFQRNMLGWFNLGRNGHVVMMINTYTILISKPQSKRPYGRPVPSWKGSIKMNLRESGCEGRDWIEVTEDKVSGWAFVWKWNGYRSGIGCLKIKLLKSVIKYLMLGTKWH
jgi:hypothetical protein